MIICNIHKFKLLNAIIIIEMKKIINLTSIIILFLTLDFAASNLILKKQEFWKYDGFIDHYWRIKSNIYHHDLMPNVNVIEPWGGTFKKRIITNSLGFRDSTIKKIKKKSEKERILLIGDSAIEGAGYNFDQTLAGLLKNKLIDKYEILNSAVGSYSPSIYYAKINHFINEGYVFDKAIIFLDPSDVIDELFINHDENGNIIEPSGEKDNVENFLVNNFLTFRVFVIFTDYVENIKNFIKLKYKYSKKFDKKFLKTTLEDAMFYRMIYVDRSAWTFDENFFPNYQEGLQKSEIYMNKLIKLLKDNDIQINFVLYPHPSQIFYKDKYHRPYWINWAKKNNINYIDVYPEFIGKDKRLNILDTFIFGDLHWNKKGTKIIFDKLVSEIF